MKFDIKYPNSEKWFQPTDESIMKGTVLKPCWHCKELTDWFDIYFEAPLCSEECYEFKWKAYEKAYNNYDQI